MVKAWCASKKYQKHPVCPHDLSLGSWLFVNKSTGTLGCKVCYLTGNASNFGRVELKRARQVTNCRLKRHEQTSVHLLAVGLLTGCRACTQSVYVRFDNAMAPSEKEFMDVWSSRRQGGAVHMIKTIGARKKDHFYAILPW